MSTSEYTRIRIWLTSWSLLARRHQICERQQAPLLLDGLAFAYPLEVGRTRLSFVVMVVYHNNELMHKCHLLVK